MSNKNVKLFNTMFQVKVEEDQYTKGHKKTKDATKKIITKVLERAIKDDGNVKVIKPGSLLQDYKDKNITTKEVIDTLVDFSMEQALADTMKALSDMDKNNPIHVKLSSLLITVARTSIEDSILSGNDDEKYVNELMRVAIFDQLNENRDYYKVTPAQFFLQRKSIPADSPVLNMNYQQLMFHMKSFAYSCPLTGEAV